MYLSAITFINISYFWALISHHCFMLWIFRTFKQGCGAFIHLYANEEGNSLIVRTLNEQHKLNRNPVLNFQMSPILHTCSIVFGLVSPCL